MQKMKLMFGLLFAANLTCGQTSDTDLVYLFAHGLYANATLADYYATIPTIISRIEDDLLHGKCTSGYTHSWRLAHPEDTGFWIIQQPLHTFNFPDASRGFNGHQTSLAQENEIKTLANEYEKIKHQRVVLVGMSRGASAILNFLGTHTANSVVAAVVESPFDSILDTLNRLCEIAGASWVPSIIKNHSPGLFFGKFDPRGVFPIKVAQNINKDLPLLIIASLQDTLIPAANSASIYFKLREHGHEHVHFLLLDKGIHAYLLEHDDAHLYLNTVHAFYKKYNLPHSKTFAAQGEAILAQCQPSKKIVDEALKNKKSFITR